MGGKRRLLEWIFGEYIKEVRAGSFDNVLLHRILDVLNDEYDRWGDRKDLMDGNVKAFREMKAAVKKAFHKAEAAMNRRLGFKSVYYPRKPH